MKKKMISMMLCAAMTAAIAAGCGSKEADQAEAPATGADAEEGAEAPAENEEETEVSDGGTLVMATNAYFEPYEYYEGDQIVGIDAEMAAAVAEKLGMELKIEDMEFDSIIPAVNSGKADMGVAGMTVTEDRLVNVNFSNPYTTATQVIIVQEGSDITGEADLNGKMIGVQLGTTGDIYASDIEGAEIEQYNKGMDAVQALSNGMIDAVIIDNEPAKQFVSKAEGLKILEEEFVTEEYAIAFAKDNEELMEKVNAALDELIADGTIQSIIDKYITAE
ncbi:MAG: basic amino acid ABC transporter substrate-binding protein [Lachnospiraceae bacterium]|jgi:ABC-type amino acid transport substrate-binding protein|nr:basic amino acid ABC transporter substrate-binding protein [Lachnospiraceae bacterium]MCI9598959.1 basic amino acid ABC transporter substrate-binding protein [Lachnospiraceae bacterium]